jgi:hypothetical protein
MGKSAVSRKLQAIRFNIPSGTVVLGLEGIMLDGAYTLPLELLLAACSFWLAASRGLHG